MIKRRFVPAICCALSTLLGSAHAGETTAQHLLDSLQVVSGAPGLSAAVMKDGEIIWTGQSGFTDAERLIPITERTQFRIASVSKLFAAAMALKLSEAEVLNIDDDIRVYVPDWPENAAGEITLRHLAAHISGIAHYTGDDNYDPTASYPSLNDSLSIYAHKPLLFSPGEKYNYSSYGYALMGAAIENATSASFEENFRQQILEPLSLTGTEVEHIDALPNDASHLFVQHGGEIPRNDQHHVVGATGILSTPSDLVTFADAYMRGAIVRPDLRDASITPATLNNGDPVSTNRFSIGFGWRIGQNWEGEPVVHHAGVTPGARSILTYNRSRNFASALLSNAAWTSRIETTGELIATAAAETVDPVHCPSGEWGYDGVFVSNPDAKPQSDNAMGAVSIVQQEGVCAVTITPKGELAVWLAALEAPIEYMNAVLVAERPGKLIFATATPWGAFPLVWKTGDAPGFSGAFASRTLELRLHSAQAPLP